MFTSTQIQKILSDEIAKINLSKSPIGLYEPIAYILGLGGKRLRPALTLFACNLFSEEIKEAISPAIGLEIFHNFTLLHDDIMDKADVRRGHTTVHKKWNDNTAILSGDAMQILAYQYVADVPEKSLSRVLSAFSKMAIEICEGQQYDVDFESREDVSEEEYINMIRLKTAVLLGTALQIGAWIGGADDSDAGYLYDFGVNIGLAFQLKDDFLDVYGDEKSFGKKIGGDILCNKKTYMLIRAQKMAEGELAEKLDYCLQTMPASQEKILAVTEIYNQLRIDEKCEEKCQFFSDKALESLDKLSVLKEKTEELRKLVKKMSSRKD